MKKRKRLNKSDLEAIINIVKNQDHHIEINQEQDPKGMMKFMNTVACRNIRESILKYLEENIHEDTIPFQDFMTGEEMGAEKAWK